MLTISDNQVNDVSAPGDLEPSRIETPKGLIKYIKSHDFNKVTTLPEKTDHASRESSKQYDHNFQKISTAPSEYLQIPSKSNYIFIIFILNIFS